MAKGIPALVRKKRGVSLFALSWLCLALPAARAQLPSIPTGPISIELQSIASGLNAPLEFIPVPDGSGRFFIVEQGGCIRVLKNGVIKPMPVLDISGLINVSGEQGLLGVAFHPGFANSASPGFRKLYTYATFSPSGAADFTVPKSSAFANQCVVTEWQMSMANPDIVDTSTRRDLLRIDHPQGNHNGGKIAFRPSDGYLYIGIGDGGGGNDVGDGHTPNLGNAQDSRNLLGKILRIDPIAPALTAGSADAVSANGKYRVPRTNPFVGAAGLDEIYAYGFRNPFRFSFDPIANRLVIGDVGQNAIEEVDVVERGKNYGWNRKEGTFLFNPANGSVSADPKPNPAYTNPVLQYDHGDGNSVIGGFAYRGSAVPALAGRYVFGDYAGSAFRSGRTFVGDLATGAIEEVRLGLNPRELGRSIKTFGEDTSGEIYVVTDSGGSAGGQIFKIVPIPALPALLNLSTRGNVQGGDNVVIAGFILTGSAPKKVVLRARGPSLNVNGQALPGRLANPTLTLQDGNGDALDANDDWMTQPRKQELIDFGLNPANPLESALVATLPPGTYTATMSGKGGATGLGLIELYDVERTAPANAVNLSTRGLTQTNDNILIGGVIIGGTTTQRIIVRAIGPDLTARGVAGALQDPTLELVNSFGVTLASNDNWRSDQVEVIATGLMPASNTESAIVRTLTPGNYTAIVRGAGSTTGVALVEIYRLAP